MERINSEIELLEKVELVKSRFENEELKPRVNTNFKCNSCLEQIDLEIIPYKTGYSFREIYQKNYLSEDLIISTKIAKPAISSFKHLGDFLVSNLPTLYFLKSCPCCCENYMIIFGCGELQPNRWVCEISGVWSVKVNQATL